MPSHHTENTQTDATETHVTTVFSRRVDEDAQTTFNDTGWTEEDKERMKQFGYDSLDMVRAWYS